MLAPESEFCDSQVCIQKMQSDLFPDQTVKPSTHAQLPRASDGKFLPGISYCPGGESKGYAKPSVRLEHILNTKKVSEARAIIEGDPILMDSAIAHAALKAATGESVNFIFDKLEPKSSAPSVVVNANSSVTSNTVVGISATMDLAREALGRIGTSSAHKEPVQD